MPSLENLKKQAKLVLRWYRDRYHPVAAQIRKVLPRFRDLTDAQILAASFNLGFAVALGKNLPVVRFLLKRGAEASSSLRAAVWRDDPVLPRVAEDQTSAQPEGPWRDADLLCGATAAAKSAGAASRGWRRSNHPGWPRAGRRRRRARSSVAEGYDHATRRFEAMPADCEGDKSLREAPTCAC